MRWASTWLVLSCVLAPRVAAAQDTSVTVRIGMTYNPLVPPGISVLPVLGPNGDSIHAIIQRDLVNSDRFNVVPLDSADPRAYRDSTTAGGLNYPMFRALNVHRVVQMTMTPTGVHVALHDVDSAWVAVPKDFVLPLPALGRDWRFSLHVIADAIVEWITGQRGIAATRIAYVANGSVRVVDSDGAGDIAVAAEPNASSPAWSPDGKAIVYSTYGTNARILSVTLATGRSQAIVPFQADETLLGPHYSPTGDSVVYFRDDGNVSALWTVSATGAGSRKIVSGLPGVNASLSFSPDGRRIAFTSGRAGVPEVYIMDADGTNPKMLTSALRIDANTYNSDPSWSPDGLRIAFQSRINGLFQLMAIKVQDYSAKQLTDAGQNVHPSWAPDSRHLVFQSDRSGAEQLWVLDYESGTVRQLTHGSAGPKLAAWSPRLQP